MICRRAVIYLVCFLFFLLSVNAVNAQDTFGPICDGVTVTCPPETPTPTTAGDTPPVGDAAPPPEPPRAGHAETLLIMTGLAGLFIASGILLHRKAPIEG